MQTQETLWRFVTDMMVTMCLRSKTQALEFRLMCLTEQINHKLPLQTTTIIRLGVLLCAEIPTTIFLFITVEMVMSEELTFSLVRALFLYLLLLKY